MDYKQIYSDVLKDSHVNVLNDKLHELLLKTANEISEKKDELTKEQLLQIFSQMLFSDITNFVQEQPVYENNTMSFRSKMVYLPYEKANRLQDENYELKEKIAKLEQELDKIR